MPEEFSRQPSTRWVKSKSQTYDSWGDQYDDYGYDYDEALNEVDEEAPEPPVTAKAVPMTVNSTNSHISSTTSASSPLVLTIDKINQSVNSLDDETDDGTGQHSEQKTGDEGVSHKSFQQESQETYLKPHQEIHQEIHQENQPDNQEEDHHQDIHQAEHQVSYGEESHGSYQESYQQQYLNDYNDYNEMYADKSHPKSYGEPASNASNSDYANHYADDISTHEFRDEERGTGQTIDNAGQSSKKSPPNNLAPISTQGLKDDSDFFPPTPTFSLKPQQQPFTPETPQSDRSYISDTDSIQREPENLNLAYGGLNEIREELPNGNTAPSATDNVPETLVFSVDHMNLNSSDDDASIDEESYRHDHEFLADSKNPNGPTYEEIVDAEHAKARIVDSSDEDDDWGYNSQHSSNEDLVGELRPTERVTSSDSTSRHPIKTDALDSLINDLLQMERLSTLYLSQTEVSKVADARSQTVPPNQDQEFDANFVPEELPSLSSIHDLSLPDFENGPATDAPTPLEKNILPQDFQKKHEHFLSNVLSRSPSVRKAPPTALKVQEEQDPKAVDSDLKLVKLVASSKFDSESKLEPVISSGSLSTGNSAFEAPLPMAPPPVPDHQGLDRRISTASAQTMNFGSWTPNTNMYRDQFVTLNDDESQMNVSIYNGDDSNYNKFTGMRPPSGYAESFSNSSMVSVPETIDAPLPVIDEDGQDEDIEIQSKLDIHTVATNGASVLNDHTYESPLFKETNTPGVSLDHLPSNELTKSETRLSSGAHSPSELRKVSETSIASTSRAPSSLIYPVFNWKKIMSVSQPVDRINMLRKAQEDEMNYETGLNYWLQEILKTSETSPNIQIGKIATQAYQNAQHSDIRRHTSIRSKVSLVKDKMETGHFASNLGRKFLSRGKKFMKSGTD